LGAREHELISGAAINGLSKDLPAFLRTPRARDQIIMLSREPDRSRNAGRAHDWARDPRRQIDLDDNGLAAGIFSPDALPQLRPLDRSGPPLISKRHLPKFARSLTWHVQATSAMQAAPPGFHIEAPWRRGEREPRQNRG
jgi:hypothetical protein